MTRVLLYARQSVSDSEDTLSLDSQAATLRRWADDQGWAIVGEIRDADQRGWNDQRPGLLTALQRAAAGEYDLLAVWSLDRLARSVRIQENALHELSRHGVEVRSWKEPWVAQPLFRVILGAVAEEQTRVMSAHMRRVFAERSRRGLPHGRAPYGYLRDESGRLTPDPGRDDTVRDLFARFAAGMGTTELAAWLTERGVPSVAGRRAWTASTIRHILENPVYTGTVNVGGVRADDAHPALIDPVTWGRAQQRIADAVWTRRKQGPGSWLEGHIHHACGARMYYVTRPTRKSTNPAFICAEFGRPGGCRLRPGRCGVAHAEDAAWSVLTGALADLQPPERVVRRLQRAESSLAPRVRSERQRLDDQRRALESERHNAEDLYLRGRRDRAWFDAVDDRITAELARATVRLTELPAAVDVAATVDRHTALCQIAGSLDLVLPSDRGAILAALGVVVVQPGTNRRPPIAIAWSEVWRPFIRRRFVFADG